MAWQRKIPFGYLIRDGLIRPHPQEADAVRYIFGQYQAGASLLTIAEDMTGRSPRYHQHTPEWNKHMVKRILENAKYVGAGGYPRLVPDGDFAAAQGQRGERNTYTPLSTDIRPIQGKAVCGLCGVKMIRGNRSHGLVHWKCQNPDCGQSISLNDEALAGLVDERLRELAQSSHLLTAPEPQRAGVDMDAVRLQNELTMALNRGSESPAYIKTLALAVTAQRYGQLPDPTPAHGLEQIRARLEEGPADAGALAALLAAAVRAVLLTPAKPLSWSWSTARSSQKNRRRAHEYCGKSAEKGHRHFSGSQIYAEGHPKATPPGGPLLPGVHRQRGAADQLHRQMKYYTQRIADTEGWTMVRLYADEGITGTSTKKRTQFNKMIRDAEKGKIDLVITKSVSRFCRNTLDGLEYIRRLKKCGVGVYFEKENTNTLYMANEMILTFLMSQAQAESESMSTNIQWGHRARFKQGIIHYNFSNFLGYRRGEDGEPEIDEEEALTVRRIFARYLMGQSVGQICRDLTADGCKTARGGTQWSDHTVRHILQNEKYMGDATLQKTFTLDLFSRQQVKNEGQLPKYYVENAHPAIIDRATFQRVQEEMARRSSLRKTSDKAKTEQGKYSGKYALGGLLICGECSSPYRRVTYMPRGNKRYVWRCINRLEHGKKVCKCAPTLEEPDIHAAVTAAMNELFRQQTAWQALADCVAAALAGAGDDTYLPAVEAKLRALQEEQMRLFRMAAEAGSENTEYDDRIAEVTAAMSALLARKGELEQGGGANAECDSRVRTITATLETADSSIGEFRDDTVRQLVSSIRVLDRERLSIRFKDGTEIEQIIECVGRASA